MSETGVTFTAGALVGFSICSLAITVIAGFKRDHDWMLIGVSMLVAGGLGLRILLNTSTTV